jgi:hypothetical protein
MPDKRDAKCNCATIFPFGGFSGMEDRAPAVSPSPQSVSQPTAKHHHEGRGAWVLTAYGISGLALFGVLAYFFSTFVVH